MINSKITIKCTCGKHTTIDVKSITQMNTKILQLQKEIKMLHEQIDFRGFTDNKNDKYDMPDFFKDIFK